jgi:hypothetical protein
MRVNTGLVLDIAGRQAFNNPCAILWGDLNLARIGSDCQRHENDGDLQAEGEHEYIHSVV